MLRHHIISSVRKLLFASTLLLAGFFLLCSSDPPSQKQEPFHSIPATTLDLEKLLGDTSTGNPTSVPAFEISNFITYGAYKEYLKEIKARKPTDFYKSQLPDVRMCSPECHQQYIASTEYDKDPVVGISWDAAMHYCHWMTLRDNPKEEINFIYRLPTSAEWVSALAYLKDQGDMNQLYSDWLFNSKDESFYLLSNTPNYSYYNLVYFQKQNDPRVLKRKVVIGDSFLYQQEQLKEYFGYSYYSFEGYRQISFRMVKEYRGSTLHFDAVMKHWKQANDQ